MKLRNASIFLTIIVALALVVVPGCGGGGGGGGDGGGDNGGDPGGGDVNVSPTVSLNAVSDAIWPEQQTDISANATDPDGDSLTYSWSSSEGTITGTGDTVTFSAPQSGGQFTVTVTVSDGQGGEAEEQIVITVGATVEGTIINARTGSPVANVSVTVDGITQATGAQGHFAITGVTQGERAVQVSGDWALAQDPVRVNADTPGQTIQAGQINVIEVVGGGPPPPPFDG